ncbi:MAG: hypothetical protein JWP59_372 [Massilia sp.]|jgi:hypothetical protein|nr:hypothetical protein [Massilia sp.]
MKTAKLRYRTHGYTSDFEEFLDQFKKTHPNIEPDQQRGWEILWDRHPGMDDLAVQRPDAVPVHGYMYE